MGGGPSQEQIEAEKNAAVYAARLQAESSAREEARKREQRAHDERTNEVERLREEHQRQRELDDARQKQLNAERTADLQRQEAERRKQELHLEKLRQEFVEEREEARRQAREEAERSDNRHKENMELMREQLANNQIQTNLLVQSLTSLMEQFQHSKSEFAEYFQQKPQQDIETPESLRATINKARRELGLDTENFYNFAFVGHTKVGKSSLINAIRGMTNEDDGSAKVGITEATHDITSYSFKDPKFQYVRIYDIPGAGTLTHDANSYYEDKCLCAFDCLIIVAQNTLGQEEVEFASKSLKFNQPIAFVRSRCDIDMDNKKKLRQIKKIDQDAIKDYISELSQHYVSEIARTGNEELKKVPCFFISSFSLYDLVIGNEEIDAIYQEPQFLDYIVSKSKFARNIVD